MQQSEFKVYAYRWVVLPVFMFVVAVNQLLWITFAHTVNITFRHM